MSSSGACGRNLSCGLFRCSNKDYEAVKVLSQWSCYHCLELQKRYFLAEINTCVAVFLRGKIRVSRDLAWFGVYFGVRTDNVHFNVFTFARECFVFRSEFALYDKCVL